MKSLRSVSSPLSSDSELDELHAGFLEGVDRLLGSIVLFDPAVVLRGEEWLAVAATDFLMGVKTTCSREIAIKFIEHCTPGISS